MVASLAPRRPSLLSLSTVAALLCLLPACDAAKKAASAEALEDLLRMREKASSGILRLKDTEVDKLVLAPRTRTFGTFVLFTAASIKYGCKHCASMEADFKLLAASYRAAATAQGGELGPMPAFFVVLDYEKSPRSFQKFGFKSVPVAVYVPPRDAALALGAAPSEVGSYETFRGTMDLANLKSFVTTQARCSFEVVQSAFWVYVLLVVASAALMVLAPTIVNNLPFIMKHVRSRTLWMLVSAAAYTCSISGFVYDIIRSPAPFYVNPNTNAITFFHPSSNVQFVAEGFIIGFLNIACSISLIYLVKFASTSSSKAAQTSAGFVCMGLFCFFFYWVLSLYTFKNRWYMR